MLTSIAVNADWDDEAKVWVATTDDIRGLAAESNTLEKLRPKVLAMIADLVEENNLECNFKELVVHFYSHSALKMPDPKAA